MDFKTLGLILFLSIFLALLIVLVTQGINIMSQLFLGGVILGGLFIVVCLVIFAIWYVFFYKPAPILSKIVMDEIIKSAHLTMIPYLQRVGVSGDKNHQGVYFGRITGWTSRPRLLDPEDTDWKIQPRKGEETKKDDKIKNKKKKKAILIHESYFTYKPFGLLSFIKPEDVVCAPEDGWEVELDEKDNPVGEPKYLPEMKYHSELKGDIDIYAVSLTRVGRYLYPSQYASSPMIDKIQMSDTFRKFGHYSQDELAGAVDRAMKSNFQMQMELQMKKLVDLSRSQTPKPEGSV